MISIIAAIGRNRELGQGNQLIWHIKEDLKKDENTFANLVDFVDKYTSDGYGKSNQEIFKEF